MRALWSIVSVKAVVNQMWDFFFFFLLADVASKAVNTLIRKLQNRRQPATVKVTDR